MDLPAWCSGSDAEQPCRGSAEERDSLVVAQSRRVEHQVDLRAGPRERVVGADNLNASTNVLIAMAVAEPGIKLRLDENDQLAGRVITPRHAFDRGPGEVATLAITQRQ
jgi:hypothetical protein